MVTAIDSGSESLPTQATNQLKKVYAGYGQKRAGFPLKTYFSFVSFYNFMLGALLLTGKVCNCSPGDEEELSIEDMILWGVASHKLSRIITKDVVTAPIRAPFTKYEELLGYGEVQEDARGKGFRLVVGDLLSCNYCADPWVALAFGYGLDKAPRQTRFLLKFFSAVALADFLHVFYETTRTRGNVLTLREEKLSREGRDAA
jgi:hypothetical protein